MNMKGEYNMKNDFIYDLMRSEEIREYYRKNVELDTEEQECVIMNCYKSLKDKLELLKKLHDNVPEEDKKDIKEMITLYELINTIYYNPYKFFGNECRVIYALHYLEPAYNLLSYNINSKHYLTKNYSDIVDYYDNIEDIIKEMSECNEYNNYSFEVDVIIIPEKGKLFFIEFYCNNINGKFEPVCCLFDDKLFSSFINNEIIDRYGSYFRCKGMPFKSGDRIKIQTPVMDEPLYGIISCEQDLNGCWYNFVYEDGKKKEDFYSSKILLDISYSNINFSGLYSLFDWLERA